MINKKLYEELKLIFPVCSNEFIVDCSIRFSNFISVIIITFSNNKYHVVAYRNREKINKFYKTKGRMINFLKIFLS